MTRIYNPSKRIVVIRKAGSRSAATHMFCREHQVRIVHGDDGAKATLAQRIKTQCPATQVLVP